MRYNAPLRMLLVIAIIITILTPAFSTHTFTLEPVVAAENSGSIESPVSHLESNENGLSFQLQIPP